MTSTTSHGSTSAHGDIFATTKWSVVFAAGRQATPQSAQALEELCRAYWFPLYVYVRGRGYSKEDSEDLTQAFFAKLLEKNYFSNLSSERGRFRAFLLASLKNFLANEWDKSHCQKRGGGAAPLSLDWETADTKFQVAAANEPRPDQAYDREWAAILLTKVIGHLQAENELDGQGRQFGQLKSSLTAEGNETTYRETAKILAMEETAVRVAVHRLRKRYRQLLRDEIIQTLSDPVDLEEEIQALFNAFRK